MERTGSREGSEVTCGHGQKSDPRCYSKAPSRRQIASRKSGDTQGCHDGRVQDHDRVRDKSPPSTPPRIATHCQVGQPVRRTPHCGEQRGRPGCRCSRLDPIEKREPVSALQQQRANPPHRGQAHTQRFPCSEAPSRSGTQARQHEDGGERQDGQRGSGVHSAHEQHRHTRSRRRPSRGPLGAGPDQRYQRPRKQDERKQLRGNGADLGQHPGRYGISQPGEQPCHWRADIESSAQPNASEEGRDQQNGHPGSLHNPTGQSRFHSEQVEGTHREEVAVTLVGDLAEGDVGVPQVQSPAQEPRRV